MNNKGFTLIELLAVIVILLGIAGVAVANITASLQRNDDRECEREKDIVKNAIKVYFSLNNYDSYNNTVSVRELINRNIIEKESDVSGILETTITIDNGKFVFEYSESDSCYEFFSKANR